MNQFNNMQQRKDRADYIDTVRANDEWDLYCASCDAGMMDDGTATEGPDGKFYCPDCGFDCLEDYYDD